MRAAPAFAFELLQLIGSNVRRQCTFFCLVHFCIFSVISAKELPLDAMTATVPKFPARCTLTLEAHDSNSSPFVVYLYDTESELNDAAIGNFILDRALDIVEPQARVIWLQRTMPTVDYEARSLHPFAYRHITLKRASTPMHIYAVLKRLFWQHRFVF